LQIKWETSRLERLTMLGKRPVRVTLFLLRLVRTLSGRHNGSGDAPFPRSASSSQVMVSPAACFDPLEALEKGPLEKSTCFASRGSWGYDVGMENGAETRLESISAQRPRADGRRVAVMEIHGRRRLGSAGLVRFATREGGVFEGQASRPGAGTGRGRPVTHYAPYFRKRRSRTTAAVG
jgi:hypothetical protein